MVVSAGEDSVIRSWTRDGKPLHSLSEPSYGACSGTYSGSIIAAFNGESTITLWDATTGKVVRVLDGHPDTNVTCVAFTADGSRLVSGGFDNWVRIWDAKTGRPGKHVEVDNKVWSVAFSHDGKLVAAGLFPATVVVIDAATGRKVAAATASKKAVTSVAFTPTGELVTGGGAGEIGRWKLEGKQLVRVLNYVKADGGGVEGLAISPDGRLMAAASRAHWMRVWELGSGKELPKLAREDVLGLDVDFSPDGRELVLAGPPSLVFVAIPER